MTQNVNFLKSLPKPSQQLPAKLIFIIAILTAVIMAIISIYLRVYQFHIGQQVKEANREYREADVAFQRVAKAYPLFASDKPLVDQVGEYEQLLQEKQVAFAKLTHETLRQPFSKYLQTLTMAAPEGLWLTAIDINQDTNNISLSGYSLQPVFVSTFLQTLKISPAFADIVFDLFYVRKVKDKDYLQFEVANDEIINKDKEVDQEKDGAVKSESLKENE